VKFVLILVILFCTNLYSDQWDNYVDSKITNTLAWDNTEIADTVSDYTLYTLIASPYVYALTTDKKLKLLGMSAIGHGLGYGLTEITKRIAKRTRPNEENNRSFFSGHTSIAFSSAGLVCIDAPRAVCGAAVALAGAVGYLRVAAKKHWFSDVLVGGTVGYLSGRYFPVLVFGF